METPNFNWDSTDFFEKLTLSNKFAHALNFRFCRVSGLGAFRTLYPTLNLEFRLSLHRIYLKESYIPTTRHIPNGSRPFL